MRRARAVAVSSAARMSWMTSSMLRMATTSPSTRCRRSSRLASRWAVHVSLDLDFVDTGIAPGVGTPVQGDPTYREAHLCMEMVADTGALASLDLVELNPALDERNVVDPE